MKALLVVGLTGLAYAARDELLRGFIALTGSMTREERGPSSVGAPGLTPRVPASDVPETYRGPRERGGHSDTSADVLGAP